MESFDIAVGITCVVCEGCGFTFSEEHADAGTDEYSCPVCAESRYLAELARLRAENERLRAEREEALEHREDMAFDVIDKQAARVGELEKALQVMTDVAQEQVRRLERWSKVHNELDGAIANARAAIKGVRDGR